MRVENSFEGSRSRRTRELAPNFAIESVAQFLARGGRIQKFPPGASGWPSSRPPASSGKGKVEANQ
jgi:hypothetical protein